MNNADLCSWMTIEDVVLLAICFFNHLLICIISKAHYTDYLVSFFEIWKTRITRYYNKISTINTHKSAVKSVTRWTETIGSSTKILSKNEALLVVPKIDTKYSLDLNVAPYLLMNPLIVEFVKDFCSCN